MHLDNILYQTCQHILLRHFTDSENECARKDLYAELDMLKLLPEHPNVVSLLGCCTRSEPLMIIVEYCANGDLQGCLRSSRGITERYYRTTYGGTVPLKVTAKTLLTFAWQIATGMMHLASFKVTLLQFNFTHILNRLWKL